MASEYSYKEAGFDGFLSRSIDNTAQVNLDSAAPANNSIRYDDQQVSGALGNQLKVGNIIIDGVAGRISVYDGQKESIRIGRLDG